MIRISDLIYLTIIARTWRNLAVYAGTPEAAFNLCALALIFDQRAEERKHRHRTAMPRLTIVSSR